MLTSKKTILVCGATGKQGGAVARSLLSRGQDVRILTRNPDKATGLAKLGAEVIKGDFDDPESLRDAVRGVDGVFLMGTPFEKGMEAEVEQGKAVINACRRHTAIHVVYSSVGCADRGTGIPHFETKYEVETHLKESGLSWTILRPVFFMENFESPWLLPSIREGVVRMAILPNKPLHMISVADIGEFAADAFLRPGEFVGQEIELAGDRLTLTDAVKLISQATGTVIRYEPIPESEAEAVVGHDFALMYRWFNEKGYETDIGAVREWGIPLTKFTKYLTRSQDVWKKAA